MGIKTFWAFAFVLLLACGGLPNALPAAMAAPAPSTQVFAGHTMNTQSVPCSVSGGLRVCHADAANPGDPDLRFKSFDGTPLSGYITLPAAPSTGPDGNYPLIVQSHGWGDPPSGPNDGQYAGPTATQLAQQGYAVLQFAARGWGNSCGTPQSRLIDPAACVNGYLHLDDYRYEARDVQYAIGVLVDEGYVDPNRVGVTGESYGGGVSLELATLKDRVMMPDGSLQPWSSPAGVPLHIAAAAPQYTWSDLVYALAPNGRTLDSQITSPTADLTPFGVAKLSIMSGLYLVGTQGAYFAPPLVNSEADVTTWFGKVLAGEPYPAALDSSLLDQIAHFHSPYYLLAGAYGMKQQAPAPLFITNGFTDDVFPVDEAVRYYNLARTLYKSNPIALFALDGGHQRGTNKPADGALVGPRVMAFFDYYVKQVGPAPVMDVTAITQACPATTPSQGPFRAPTWDALHPGEVRYTSAPAQNVLSTGGDLLISKTFDPVAGGLACTTAPSTNQGQGIATYDLPPATGPGYTLLGSPQVTANLTVTGIGAYLAARLLDVDPATQTETLLARGLYRIDPAAPNGIQTFQLHPGAWHFAAGHIPRLQLLGQDTPYARPSNGVFTVAVSDLLLRLPVHDVPGAPGTPAMVTSSTSPATPGTSPTDAPSEPDKGMNRATPQADTSHYGLAIDSGLAGQEPDRMPSVFAAVVVLATILMLGYLRRIARR